MSAYIPRLSEEKIQSWHKSGKILLLLGARQVGKTTLIKKVFANTKMTYLNMDIPVDKQRLLAATPLDPQSAIDVLGKPEILIIDEAQRIPEISRVVKGWYDNGTFSDVILSGSSSLNLLDQSAESLTGRNIKIFLPQLTFYEIVRAQSWYSEKLNLQQFSEQLSALLIQLIVYGSYPETITTTEKTHYLQNLVSDYLLKDILRLGLVKTPHVLERLLLLLAYQIGSVVSINEIATNLGISRVTVEKYIDLLEETFVIFKLPAYSTNPRKEISKSQKIYFWDTGVRNTLIGELQVNPMRSDIGQLWENWVVSEFAKKNLIEGNTKKLYFWRSRQGSEVDLLIKDEKANLRAYEMKWSPQKKAARFFTDTYKIPLSVVHRDNIVEYLMSK